MGDLHLAPEQMHLFNQARDQLVKAMSEDGKLIPGEPTNHPEPHPTSATKHSSSLKTSPMARAKTEAPTLSPGNSQT